MCCLVLSDRNTHRIFRAAVTKYAIDQFQVSLASRLTLAKSLRANTSRSNTTLTESYRSDTLDSCLGLDQGCEPLEFGTCFQLRLDVSSDIPSEGTSPATIALPAFLEAGLKQDLAHDLRKVLSAYWVAIAARFPGKPSDPGGPTRTLELDVILDEARGWDKILIQENSLSPEVVPVISVSLRSHFRMIIKVLGIGGSLFVALSERERMPFLLPRFDGSAWKCKYCRVLLQNATPAPDRRLLYTLRFYATAQ